MNRTLQQCHNCRYAVLNTFASIVGISIPQQKIPAIHHSLRSFPRSLTTSSLRRSPLDQQDRQTSRKENLPPTSSTSSTVPWYLQIPNPSPPAQASSAITTQHILAAQEIPPIPSDAPEILSPILSHLSTTIGLDNLALLDLRHLTDPPPALGANLIMILGTARSTKHLNVSADRFCRWCRSEYKLKPYADGLLGRNELKLKLRRRARRLKLAQSVGNTVAIGEGEYGFDDGITTGWICVNLGIVEDRGNTGAGIDAKSSGVVDMDEDLRLEGDQDQDQDQILGGEVDNYIGFGSQSIAPRIVVQMFTESKRAEMDLEGLWDTRKSSRLKKEERVENDNTY